MTMTWSRVLKPDEEKSPQWFITTLYGRGSSDDPRTKSVDEGYTGETAAFAPDLIFLNSLSPAMVTGEVAGIKPSLSNKEYVGLRYTTTEPEFSLLRAFLVHILRLDGDHDLATSASSFSVHNYRFRRDVFDKKSAGTEVDTEFLVKAPRGVTATVSMGYFFRGDALRQVAGHRPWTAAFVISFEP